MARASYVDANYRYIAAYNELNTRIGQRQQVLALYVSLVVALLAGLVALRPDGDARLPVDWLVLGFPLASSCLVLLNYKSERALTNLRHFLATLERLDTGDEPLPGYNTDPRWAEGANHARRFHDLTSAMLVAASNAVAVGVLLRLYPHRLAADSILLWIVLAVAALCILALLLMPRFSYRPRT